MILAPKHLLLTLMGCTWRLYSAEGRFQPLKQRVLR